MGHIGSVLICSNKAVVLKNQNYKKIKNIGNAIGNWFINIEQYLNNKCNNGNVICI